MIALVRAEWLKLRTTAVPWVLTGIALVINALLILIFFLNHGTPGTAATAAVQPQPFVRPDSYDPPHHPAAAQPHRSRASPATCSPCCSACSS